MHHFTLRLLEDADYDPAEDEEEAFLRNIGLTD
jgi:hypothetical protein